MKKTLLFLLLFFWSIALSQTTTAKVIGVKDGDTVVLLVNGKPQTVRLAHIDCPEKSQDFGAKAKKFTSDFCFGKTVRVVQANKPDRYGRWIVELFYNNQNLGKELVRNGLAWHFKKYSRDETYAQLEIIVRQKKIGLWQLPNAVAPWDFRKIKRSKIIVVKKVA